MLRSRLTRTVRFFALHYLARPDWSAEQNRAAFGPLCDPAGHGHDYACTVTVSGSLRFGMVMDLGELDRLLGAVERKGHTIVPLKLYWKNGNVKLEIGLAKGKQSHDKRATEKDRDWQRDKSRLMRSHGKK